MSTRLIVAVALLATLAGCASDTTGPEYAQVEVELIWPNLDDPDFIGTTYLVSSMRTYSSGAINDDWVFEMEVDTVASGRIPEGRSSWAVRFVMNCGGSRWFSARGYYEANGPEVECAAFRNYKPRCDENPQTVVLQTQYCMRPDD